MEVLRLTLKIIYNPYRIHSDFFIDDLRTEDFESFSKKRIQDWDYSSFSKTLNDRFNLRELEIVFVGRKIDVEDFKYHLIQVGQNNKRDITIRHKENFDNKTVIKKLNRYYELLLNKYSDELKKTNIKEIIEKTNKKEFPISVMATMSSGKSTLINAMLGTELLPAENQACTAKITSIKDIDGLKQYSAKAFDKNNNEINDIKKITADILRELNNKEEIERIEIIGDIPNISSEYMNLVLYDTPGPNNSRNQAHKEHTKKMIQSEEKPMILYIMNATQLAITDDRDLLLEISDEIKKSGNISKDRFLFVINKSDRLDPEQDGTIEELVGEAKKYLEMFDIENPKIFPVSAEFAKLLRMHTQNIKLSHKKRKALKNHEMFLEYLKLDEFAPFTYSTKKALLKKLENAQGNSFLEALYHTGIPSLEIYINEYLYKYALPVKIAQAVEDIQQLLNERKLETETFVYFCSDEELVESIQIQNTEEIALNFNEIKKIVEEVDFKIQELYAEVESESENTGLNFKNATELILQNTLLLEETVQELAFVKKTNSETEEKIGGQLKTLNNFLESGIPEILDQRFNYENSLLDEMKKKLLQLDRKLQDINQNYQNLTKNQKDDFSNLISEGHLHTESLKSIQEMVSMISKNQKESNLRQFREEITVKFTHLKEQLEDYSQLWEGEFGNLANLIKENHSLLLSNSEEISLKFNEMKKSVAEVDLRIQRLFEEVENGIPEILDQKSDYANKLLDEMKKKLQQTEDKLQEINKLYQNLNKAQEEKFSSLSSENLHHTESIKSIKEIVSMISKTQKENDPHRFREEITEHLADLKGQLEDYSHLWEVEIGNLANLIKENHTLLLSNNETISNHKALFKELSEQNDEILEYLKDDSKNQTLLEKISLIHSSVNEESQAIEWLKNLNKEGFDENKEHRAKLIEYFTLHEARIQEIEEKFEGSLETLHDQGITQLKEHQASKKLIDSLSEMLFKNSDKVEAVEESLSKMSKLFFFLFGLMMANFLGVLVLIIIFFLK